MKPTIMMFEIALMVLLASAAFAQGLEITEIDVDVDYDEAYTYRIENRDRLNSASVPASNNSKISVDILPGSNVTFTVRVANTFTGEEPKIKGAFVTITIEDIDDGADLDETSLDVDLEPGDDFRADVRFPIPLDAKAATYNVRMEAEGEDRNETLYRTQLNQKLEVKKQSHDIRITKASLTSSVLGCDRKTKLTAEVMNMGSNAESQIGLEFKSASLGINSADRDIFLESSDEASEEEKIYVKSLSIELPSLFKAGTYSVLVNLYWKNFVLFDQKVVELVVRDCGKEIAQKPGEDEEPAPEEKEEASQETETSPEAMAPVSSIRIIKKMAVFKAPVTWMLILGAVLIAAIAYAIININIK